jgi:hypothetical protein
MAHRCGSCGNSRRADDRRGPSSPASTSDRRAVSNDALIAASRPRYLVVASQLATEGRRFATLTAAQDYARSSGGIVRQL